MHVSDHRAQKIMFTVDYHYFSRFFGRSEKEEYLGQLLDQDWQLVQDVNKKDVDGNGTCSWQILKEYYYPRNPNRNLKIHAGLKINAIKCKLDILLVLKNSNQLYNKAHKNTKKKYDKASKEEKRNVYENWIKKSDNKRKTMWHIKKCKWLWIGRKTRRNWNQF